MNNTKLTIVLLSCLLIATVDYASSQESSSEISNIGDVINNLPPTLKNLANAIPLKGISDIVSNGTGGRNLLLGLVLGLVQLLLLVLSLPIALVGIVLTLVGSILAAVVTAVIALLSAL